MYYNIFYYAYKLRYSQIEPKDHSKIADRKNLGTYLFSGQQFDNWIEHFPVG